MDDNIAKDYKDLVVKKTNDYDNIVAAIDVVKKYIIFNKLCLVGGTAIDCALKLKNKKGIYDNNVLPDFDIISSQHFKHAYDIATTLARKNFTGISVINALHPSTMRIRINFKEVCDITYMPENILNGIPTLTYHGFTLVHPHFQYIDQHRALSYPYENAPYETITHRLEKDLIRYDLLYEQYPLRILNTDGLKVNIKLYQMSLHTLKDQCVSGFFALNYWLQQAKILGFQTNYYFGNNNFTNTIVSGKMPQDANIVLYSNDIATLYNNLQNKSDAKFYMPLLDKLPRKIMCDIFEIFDLQQKITAHKITKFGIVFYVANLQAVMLYLQINYIILQKLSNKKRSYAYYAGYLACRDIILWASKKYTYEKDTNLELFFPTAEVYGINNFSDSYIVAKYNFDVKNKTITHEKNIYAQPHQVFDRDLAYNKVPKKYYEFDINASEIFNLSGSEIDNFIKL